MFVCVVVVIMNNGMRHTETAEQVHKAVNVVLAETVQYIGSLRQGQLSIVQQTVDQRCFAWPFHQQDMLSKKHPRSIWIKPQAVLYGFHVWLQVICRHGFRQLGVLFSNMSAACICIHDAAPSRVIYLVDRHDAVLSPSANDAWDPRDISTHRVGGVCGTYNLPVIRVAHPD